MLKNILDLFGVQTISAEEQKTIKGGEVFCKENGMCAQYGGQCVEMACQEMPAFEM
ncbi:hypothetical protein FLJC2902T_01650 [Flavobacterium limnosediminis JC2902]|uniref:Uncharacterized protein n=1 Tax=Flavobacterium limnosediminis JC2902 TaxID=1341181 RepID=V6SU49_9FLAO|nr:hypothetical protein [Flavobacterium limnosediminis]ESU29692.1 hypothetical protein FLJC2902T_01650 [Flavobacterium limnosediminis JC2902]